MSRIQHPEATAGEVFMGNLYAADFPAVGWSTKRMGKIPRDTLLGKPLKGGNMRPVFIQRAEVEAAGVEIPDIGPIDHRW